MFALIVMTGLIPMISLLGDSDAAPSSFTYQAEFLELVLFK